MDLFFGGQPAPFAPSSSSAFPDTPQDTHVMSLSDPPTSFASVDGKKPKETEVFESAYFAQQRGLPDEDREQHEGDPQTEDQWKEQFTKRRICKSTRIGSASWGVVSKAYEWQNDKHADIGAVKTNKKTNKEEVDYYDKYETDVAPSLKTDEEEDAFIRLDGVTAAGEVLMPRLREAGFLEKLLKY